MGKAEGKHVRRSSCMNGWLTTEYNHTIREVRGHDKIVFDHEGGTFRVENKSTYSFSCVGITYSRNKVPFDDFACCNTLFRVQERTWFVN